MKSWSASVLTATLASTALAIEPCPLLGPVYPAPRDLSSNSSLVTPSWANLTSQLDAVISGKVKVGLNISSNTFSIGAFSIHDPQAQQLFQYHHTGASVANASKGVTSVDEHSVYRIGSLSKLLTVYLMLIEAGSSYWDSPITKFIPELATAAANGTSKTDTLDQVKWEDVTIAALAGQMAGIARDPSNLIEELGLILPQAGVNPTSIGFPPANMSDPGQGPVCVKNANSPCTREQLFSELLQRGPVFETWTTPIYSNIAYALLAIALEQMQGKPFEAMFQDSLIAPLSLTSTSYNVPSDLSRAVLPGGDALKTFFAAALGNETAAGGMFSSLADISAIGVSILNSTLLTPAATRKWLKPIAHSASLSASVGQPWEIFRFAQPATGGRISDLYTKEGDLGSYSTYLVLSPDHDAGFSILAAGDSTALLVNTLADLVTNTYVVALEAQAVAEAKTNLVGTYSLSSSSSSSNSPNSSSSANSTTGASSSSSITFALPTTGTGLQIANWTSNGRPLLPLLAAQFGATDIRVYPTNVLQKTACGGQRVAFRATITRNQYDTLTGLFAGGIGCRRWQSEDSFLYAKKPLDEFVFELDGMGKALAVTPAALRKKLTLQA